MAARKRLLGFLLLALTSPKRIVGTFEPHNGNAAALAALCDKRRSEVVHIRDRLRGKHAGGGVYRDVQKFVAKLYIRSRHAQFGGLTSLGTWCKVQPHF